MAGFAGRPINNLADRLNLSRPPPATLENLVHFLDQSFRITSFDIQDFHRLTGDNRELIEAAETRLEAKIDASAAAITLTLKRLITEMKIELKGEYSRSEAKNDNRNLYRLHQELSPIYVFYPESSTWKVCHKFPRQLKDVLALGQHGKGEFDLENEKKKSAGEKQRLQSDALRNIKSLAEFYKVTPQADTIDPLRFIPDSEPESSDDTSIPETQVDGYMVVLLRAWGLSWENVVKIGEKQVTDLEAAVPIVSKRHQSPLLALSNPVLPSSSRRSSPPF